jgi:hypothetical protein
VFVSQVYVHSRALGKDLCCMFGPSFESRKIDLFLNSFNVKFTNRYGRREMK